MSITTIYHVSVRMPDEADYHSKAYELEVLQITKHAIQAGTNTYSEIEEWAEFNDRRQAEICEQKLKILAEKIQLELDKREE